MTKMVPAWKTVVYWRSNLSREGEWFKVKHCPDDGKIFKTRKKADAWAAKKTGVPSPFVPYMERRVEIIECLREETFGDRFRAAVNQKPIWQERNYSVCR